MKKKKKILIIGLICLIFIAAGVIFHSYNKNQLSGYNLLKYSTYDNNIYMLVSKDKKFYILKEKNILISSTKEIENIYADKSNIFYVEKIDDDLFSVNKYDIKLGKSSVVYNIHSGYACDICGGLLYIYEKTSNQICIINDKGNIKQSSSDTSFDYILKYNQRIFGISKVGGNGAVLSYVYEFDKTGKATMLFKDNNIVYISYNSKSPNILYYVVQSSSKIETKYVDMNRYNFNDESEQTEKKICNELNGEIICMKNNYININRNTGLAYKLNDELFISNQIFKIKNDLPWRFVKYDESTDSIYYINDNNTIKNWRQ